MHVREITSKKPPGWFWQTLISLLINNCLRTEPQALKESNCGQHKAVNKVNKETSLQNSILSNPTMKAEHD